MTKVSENEILQSNGSHASGVLHAGGMRTVSPRDSTAGFECAEGGLPNVTR